MHNSCRLRHQKTNDLELRIVFMENIICSIRYAVWLIKMSRTQFYINKTLKVRHFANMLKIMLTNWFQCIVDVCVKPIHPPDQIKAKVWRWIWKITSQAWTQNIQFHFLLLLMSNDRILNLERCCFGSNRDVVQRKYGFRLWSTRFSQFSNQKFYSNGLERHNQAWFGCCTIWFQVLFLNSFIHINKQIDTHENSKVTLSILVGI